MAPESRVCLVGLLALACGQDDRVVVGRWLEPGVTCGDGPSGYSFCTVADPGSTSDFVAPPSAAEARVHVVSADYGGAGVAAELGETSLGTYDQLVFAADVPTGQVMEVLVGSSLETGCLYPVTGAGSAQYVVDLGSPAWCEPSLCGHELVTNAIAFRTAWRWPADVEFAVRSLELRTATGPVGAVNALHAGLGPGGACWYPFAWDVGDATWTEPVSAAVAHVTGTAPANSKAGVGYQIIGAPVDLRGLARLEADATVAAGTPFLVGVVSAERPTRGCQWPLTGAGTTTYVVDLTLLSDCWGTPPFDLGAAARIELSTPYATGGTLDVSVTAVRLLP